jgi:hypothetical protein
MPRPRPGPTRVATRAVARTAPSQSAQVVTHARTVLGLSQSPKRGARVARAPLYSLEGSPRSTRVADDRPRSTQSVGAQRVIGKAVATIKPAQEVELIVSAQFFIEQHARRRLLKQAWGRKPTPLEWASASITFNYVDSDVNGRIEASELAAIVSERFGSLSPEVFEVFNDEGEGYVDFAGYAQITAVHRGVAGMATPAPSATQPKVRAAAMDFSHQPCGRTGARCAALPGWRERPSADAGMPKPTLMLTVPSPPTPPFPPTNPPHLLPFPSPRAPSPQAAPGGDATVTDLSLELLQLGDGLASETERLADFNRSLAQGEHALKYLIRSNQGMVHQIARQLRPKGLLDLEDMLQDGNLGLMQAIVRFEPATGCRLSTYSYQWIRGLIMTGLHRCAHAPASLARQPALPPPPRPAAGPQARTARTYGRVCRRTC